jgi:uncharacterized lipoprotein YmbA
MNVLVVQVPRELSRFGVVQHAEARAHSQELDRLLAHPLHQQLAREVKA